jgi:cell shape-determining protein MreC
MPVKVVRGQRSEVSEKKSRVLLLTVFCGLVFSVSAAGQTSVQAAIGRQTHAQEQDELKTQEQILDELRFKRAQAAALQQQVAAMTEQVKTLQELATALRERGDFYKEAAEERNGANVLEAERERMRREQVEELKAEVARLRVENDRLRRSRDVRTVVGFAAGVGVGVLGGRR